MYARLVHGYACAYQESRTYIYMGVYWFGWVGGRSNLHVKALLKALVYMILWFDYNVMDVVNAIILYLVIICDATNEFLLGHDKDLLN